jgi:hypothetical protein
VLRVGCDGRGASDSVVRWRGGMEAVDAHGVRLRRPRPVRRPDRQPSPVLVGRGGDTSRNRAVAMERSTNPKTASSVARAAAVGPSWERPHAGLGAARSAVPNRDRGVHGACRRLVEPVGFGAAARTRRVPRTCVAPSGRLPKAWASRTAGGGLRGRRRGSG